MPRVLPAAERPADAGRFGADRDCEVPPCDCVGEVPLGEPVGRDPAGAVSPVGVWRTGVGSGGALTTGFVIAGVVTCGVETGPTVTDGVVTDGIVIPGTLTVGTDTVGTDTAGTDTVGTDTVGIDTVGIFGAAVEIVAGTSSAPHVTRAASPERRTATNPRTRGRTGQRSPPDLSPTEGLDIALPPAHRSSSLGPRASI